MSHMNMSTMYANKHTLGFNHQTIIGNILN